MKGFLVGLLVFAAFIALATMFVYPWVFTTISGLFENADLGTVVALVVCFGITGLVFVVSLFASMFAGAFTQAIADDRKFKRDYERRRRR